MLDLRQVVEVPTLIEEGLLRRGLKVDLTSLKNDGERLKKLQQLRSKLQSEGNSIGKEVGQKIRTGSEPNSKEISSLRNKGNEIKKKVALLEEEEKTLSKEIKACLLNYPNIPHLDCPEGKDESYNKLIRSWGNPKEGKSFKEHWQIAEKLNIIDTERSVRISKSRFVTLFNQGARLERALINFMLDIHTSKGYIEVFPPALVNTSSLEGSGQLPKFEEEIFKCSEDDLWLTPTAEVPLTSLHRNEIIPFENMPLKYVAYSPCFRREAGSYGRDTRGLIRLHQFNKVELYWFTNANKSKESHQQITADAEAILQALELPYRVIELCTGDLGFSASCTYDLEVWLPGSNAFREISSSSNCDAFQARRSSIRTKQGKQTQLVHTLNASGLAIGRTMAAILENGQQTNGNVRLPKALVPYFGEKELKSQ